MTELLADTRVFCDICGENCSGKYTKLTLPYYFKMGEGNIDGVMIENKTIKIKEKDVCPRCVKSLCNYLNIAVNSK